MTEKKPEELPDATGIVRRGGAAEVVRGHVEQFGEPPICFVGLHRYDDDRMAPGACERPAVMEVYGIVMCEAHGEEAAYGALEEIAYDLEQELQRPMNPHVRSPGPHIEAALRYGFGILPEEAGDHERADAALLEAFPLERSRACAETLAYAEDPDGIGTRPPPSDAYRSARTLLHRHMRLAFEERASWLVEVLERARVGRGSGGLRARAGDRGGVQPPSRGVATAPTGAAGPGSYLRAPVLWLLFHGALYVDFHGVLYPVILKHTHAPDRNC